MVAAQDRPGHLGVPAAGAGRRRLGVEPKTVANIAAFVAKVTA
ncbi:hypothetical protein [Micromonospora sp. RTGN7]|nr:hypothetical protein [Micromonospora sp. RTGN7]